ncbi:hypothetical protein OH492_11055 [Vibrio chagasii]|nr:hypothetical protein [Vibrio chagasii]
MKLTRVLGTVLFIAYNGVKYSLLKRNRLLVQIRQAGVAQAWYFSALLIELTVLVTLGASLGHSVSFWDSLKAAPPTVAILHERFTLQPLQHMAVVMI